MLTRVKKQLIIGAVTGLVLCGLGGCSAEYWPGNQAAGEVIADTATPPTVSDAQIARIVQEVVQVAHRADKNLDAQRLATRFQGDALELRKANYTIRASVTDYGVQQPHLVNTRLGYELVQQTEQWPRTIFVTIASAKTLPATTESTEAETSQSPSLALLLTQEDSHTNFKVSKLVALQGGIEMPQAAPAHEGTAVLESDAQNLLVTPQQALSRYAQLLAEGPQSKQAQLFVTDKDPVFASGGQAWVQAETARVADQEAKAAFSVSAEVSGKAIALSTGAGGALVLGTVYEYRKTTADTGSELPIGAVVTAISGMSGKTKEITHKVQHQLLFYVPGHGSKEKIQLLGSSSELIGAQ